MPSNTVITQRYDNAVLAKMQEKLDGVTDENQPLREQLANAKHETIIEIEEVDNVLAAPILLTFPINKATIDNEARVQLGFVAEIIKRGGPDVVYSVTGYADLQKDRGKKYVQYPGDCQRTRRDGENKGLSVMG